MLKIPEDYTEFLHWVKERTESFWSKDHQNSEDDFQCEEWLRGAKWIGLKEAQIDEVEQRYGVEFTPDHREFLKVLHTLDRKCIVTDPDQFPEDTEVFYKEVSFFYDWLSDDKEIREMLHWPYRTILQDVEGANQVWLESWGKRSPSDKERETIFTQWYKQAPRLIPIMGHRFLVSEPLQSENPVLSVWGSDIIVYGWNLRSYLLAELEKDLGLLELVFDEEDQQWYPETQKEAKAIITHDYATAVDKHIPYWEEMILYWSSGWSSFGRKCPFTTDGIIQPIIKANTSGDNNGTGVQKRFNSFD